MTAQPNTRCAAVVLLHDDRYGTVRDQCELPAGHAGEHSIEYTATEPVAHLRWSTEAVTTPTRVCPRCHGVGQLEPHGYAEDAPWPDCPVCHGKGVIAHGSGT